MDVWAITQLEGLIADSLDVYDCRVVLIIGFYCLQYLVSLFSRWITFLLFEGKIEIDILSAGWVFVYTPVITNALTDLSFEFRGALSHLNRLPEDFFGNGLGEQLAGFLFFT